MALNKPVYRKWVCPSCGTILELTSKAADGEQRLRNAILTHKENAGHLGVRA